ncbi:hypothetical protein E4T56_gene8204 [Termitomyces sp. T112]|nr:hypothetical protein E4T56_gene8204 [Termitomyces sp. T112]KAH0585035.1 hypothetical protein H2248_008304 [Termitomyces sp. 'cryptogamus']KNZ72165.1 hypothetical protein J132_04446 [Termitomyces sp. J132]
MYTAKVSETFYASTDMNMDAEQTWEDWINLEACTPAIDASPVFSNKYQQPVNLNYDYSEFNTWAQYATDVCSVPAIEYPVSLDSFISRSQGLTVSSISSPISSSSISISSSRSPSLSPQSTRNYDLDKLVSVSAAADVINPSPIRPLSSPPPIQPISKSLRSPKRSSRRAIPYEVPSSRTPSPVKLIRHKLPPFRSLRPRGAQKYREPTPYLSEDDDDTAYTSDEDFKYSSQSPRRRGAPSLQSQTRILHQIQCDTSLTSCPICANGFSRHADVIRHYLSVHYIKSDVEILNDTSNKRLHCLGCTKILSRKDSRERHEAICPVYCAQRGTVPSPVRTIKNSDSI